MDNAGIADRLDAFAALLELAEANPYTPRAYRRAAEMIRSAPLPVAELVRSGRARELRPEVVALGRYLGLSAKRTLEIARALGTTSADDFRDAIAGGRLREVR